jgi:hypothetical protein
VTELTTAARCLGCPWTAAGNPAATDKAADKHTAAGHPTATVTTPARAEPDGRADR